jgi:Calpain family cysteine protease
MTSLSSVSVTDILDRLQEALQPASPADAAGEIDVGREFAASGSAASTVPATTRFDAGDLYDASGNPRPQDIDQDAIGDCYFVATLAALAGQQPDRIKNAISYDASTGTFTVKMYKEEWGWFPPGYDTKEVSIKVTQQDIQDNLTRRGGSTVDNKTGVDGPIWPAVMETAYAKMNDGNWSNGLDQGYKEIDGGWAKDAMFAVTGTEGDNYSAIGYLDSKTSADILHGVVSKALSDGRAVTLSTDPESASLYEIIKTGKVPQDGLVDNHVYSVERIYKNSSGEVMVDLRNPWGSNNNVGEGMDTPNAVITVKLSTLIDTGGLDCFNVGPRK